MGLYRVRGGTPAGGEVTPGRGSEICGCPKHPEFEPVCGNVFKAEALSVEIANIHKGLQDIVTSPNVERRPGKDEDGCRRCRNDAALIPPIRT